MKEKLSEEERAAKRREKFEKRHVVSCPHCGKNVLDHMTQCPYCGGQLNPYGYRPPDPKKYKIIKLVCTVVGIVAAVGIAIAIILTR